MKTTNNPASRFSSNFHHASFGINNYLSGKGYTSEEISKIIEDFIIYKEFKNYKNLPTKQLNKTKLTFIQNNWKHFIAYIKTLS
jgi:hypothetical protein